MSGSMRMLICRRALTDVGMARSCTKINPSRKKIQKLYYEFE